MLILIGTILVLRGIAGITGEFPNIPGRFILILLTGLVVGAAGVGLGLIATFWRGNDRRRNRHEHEGSSTGVPSDARGSDLIDRTEATSDAASQPERRSATALRTFSWEKLVLSITFILGVVCLSVCGLVVAFFVFL